MALLTNEVKGALAMPLTVHDGFWAAVQGASKVYAPISLPWKTFLGKGQVASDPKAADLVITAQDVAQYVTIPTLAAWAMAWNDHRDADLPKLLARSAKRFRASLEEIAKAALPWGVIDGAFASHDMLGMLAITAATQRGLTTWQDVQAKEFTWMFVPESAGHLTPMAQKARASRGAIGQAHLAYGMWQLAPATPAEMAAAVEIAWKSGIPAIPEEKGRYLYSFPVAFGEGGKLSLPFGAGSKAEKSVARGKLLQADTAAIHGGDVDSNLYIHGVPATSGKRITVTYANGVPGAYDGGALWDGKPFWVLEHRTHTAQVKLGTPIAVSAGDAIPVGQSVVGIQDVELAKFPSLVRDVVVVENKALGIATITVKVHVAVLTSSPKLRGSGVKSTCAKDVTGGLGRKPALKQTGTEAWVTPKNQLATLSLWANTTGVRVNVTEKGISADDQAEYQAWMTQNTKKVTVSWEVDKKLAAILKSVEDVTVKYKDGKRWATCEYITVSGTDVVEVESPVTEIRQTSTAVTPLAAIEMAKLAGSQFHARQVPTYAAPTARLTFAHAMEVLGKPFPAQLKRLGELYPEGCIITNGAGWVVERGGQAEPAEAFVSFDAVAQFSQGEIRSNDPLSKALSQALTEKCTFGLAVERLEKKETSIVEVSQASQRLGQALRYFVAACKGLSLSKSVLKKLSSGARCATLFTVRAYDRIPVHELRIHPISAAQAHLEDGAYVASGRHPTALFATAWVRYDDTVPLGVVECSSLFLAATNKGDSDGDQLWVCLFDKATHLHELGGTVRRNASKLISMAAWNMGIEVEPTLEGERLVSKVSRVKAKDVFANSLVNYTRHAEMADTTLAKAYVLGNFHKKLVWDNTSHLFSVPEMESYIPFGTSGLGLIYGTMFAAYIRGELGYELGHEAFLVSQDAYEDVFLAGWTPERALVAYCLDQSDADAKGAQALVDALADCGLHVSVRVAQEMLVARDIHREASRAEEPTGEALVYKAMRSLASGRKDWIVSPQEWDMIIAEAGLSPALAQVFDSLDGVYRLLAQVTHAQNEAQQETWADD